MSVLGNITAEVLGKHIVLQHGYRNLKQNCEALYANAGAWFLTPSPMAVNVKLNPEAVTMEACRCLIGA